MSWWDVSDEAQPLEADLLWYCDLVATQEYTPSVILVSQEVYDDFVFLTRRHNIFPRIILFPRVHKLEKWVNRKRQAFRWWRLERKHHEPW